MLQYLNQCSRKRGAWILLSLSVFSIEIFVLWLQNIAVLKPCVMCIYERCALFGIMGAGLVGSIAPNTPLRYVALAIWLYSSWKGIYLSYEHIMIQLHSSPLFICELSARFPSWLPLNKWLPTVFVATSNCTDRTWSFLTLSMPQWLMVIFTICFIVGLLVLISQFFQLKRHGL